jgi:hypothetical protein
MLEAHDDVIGAAPDKAVYTTITDAVFNETHQPLVNNNLR